MLAAGTAAGAQKCKEALAACGIDPDNFENYSDVADAQGTACKELREAARVAGGDTSRRVRTNAGRISTAGATKGRSRSSFARTIRPTRNPAT
jgi:hypothetical protein